MVAVEVVVVNLAFFAFVAESRTGYVFVALQTATTILIVECELRHQCEIGRSNISHNKLQRQLNYYFRCDIRNHCEI